MRPSEVTPRQADILRRMSTAERLRAAFALYDFARARISAYLREMEPGISEEALAAKVRERLSR